MKRSLIAMEGEHETGGRIGELRSDAREHAECRGDESGTDPGVAGITRGDRVWRSGSGRGIRLGGAGSGGAGIRPPGADVTRPDPGAGGEDHRAEHIADDTADSDVSGLRAGTARNVYEKWLYGSLYGCRYRAAGGGGACARTDERASDATHSGTGAHGVRATECARLAEISVAHLYNLRNGKEYRRQAAAFDATRPTAVSIGERRKPDPQERPGFLRVDTCASGGLGRCQGSLSHQRSGHGYPMGGDRLRQQDQRGVSDAGFGGKAPPVPVPATGVSLRQRQLEKLHAEFTKSRAGKCQNNALAEGKNGAVIRNRKAGREWETDPNIQDQRLRDTVREAEIAAGCSRLTETTSELQIPGSGGRKDDRHRISTEDDRRQNDIAASVQNRTAGTTAVCMKPAGGEKDIGRYASDCHRFHAHPSIGKCCVTRCL